MRTKNDADFSGIHDIVNTMKTAFEGILAKIGKSVVRPTVKVFTKQPCMHEVIDSSKSLQKFSLLNLTFDLTIDDF